MTEEWPTYRRRMVVDGIESTADWECETVNLPMFSLIDPAVSYGGAAVLRCSRPYTPDEERRWLSGAYSTDLDHWGGF